MKKLVFEHVSVRFDYDDENLEWEDMDLHEVIITDEQLIKLKEGKRIKTWNWHGTIVGRCTKDAGEYEVSEPAFNGEYYTNDIPKKEALYIDGCLFSMAKIVDAQPRRQKLSTGQLRDLDVRGQPSYPRGPAARGS